MGCEISPEGGPPAGLQCGEVSSESVQLFKSYDFRWFRTTVVRQENGNMLRRNRRLLRKAPVLNDESERRMDAHQSPSQGEQPAPPVTFNVPLPRLKRRIGRPVPMEKSSMERFGEPVPAREPDPVNEPEPVSEPEPDKEPEPQREQEPNTHSEAARSTVERENTDASRMSFMEVPEATNAARKRELETPARPTPAKKSREEVQRTSRSGRPIVLPAKLRDIYRVGNR